MRSARTFLCAALGLAAALLVDSVPCAAAAPKKDLVIPVRGALSILGVNPREVEIGDSSSIRFSRRPLTANLAITVGGIPVEALPDAGGLWWKFRVPAELPRGVSCVVIAQDGTSRAVWKQGLVVRPLRVLSVRPGQAAPGERVTLLLSAALPRIVEARVWFDSLPAPVALAAGDSVVVAVPEGLLNDTTRSANPRLRVDVAADTAALDQALLVSAGGGAVGSLTRDPWLRVLANPLTQLALALTAGIWTLFAWRSVRRRRMPSAREAATPLAPAEAPPAPVEGPSAAPTPPGPAPPEFELPEIELPPDLVEACVRGDCILYAGAGLSARANMPQWRPFITELLDWSTSQGLVDPEFGHSLHAALDQGDEDRVADSLVSQVRRMKGGLDVLATHIRERFSGAESGAPSDVHRMLPSIGFGAALTTNFDHLLERAFGGDKRDVVVRLPREVEELRGDLSQRRFFILKLYGDVDRADSLILSPAQYEEVIQGDRPFADVMQEIFLTRTILFLGCSLKGMDAYLRGLRFQTMATPRHYAVIGASDQGWRVAADGLSRRYGIQVLPYAADAGHSPLPRFVEKLQRAVTERAAGSEVPSAAPSAGGIAAQPVQRPLLRSIELTNIGPFDRLELEFNTGWTVLLGDNGVGKSTILKAIALAVAGEHAGPFAGRLLKAGTTQGQILIRATNHQTYIAEIFVNSLGKPEARSVGARAFGAETLVLGFPPARSIAMGPAKAPQVLKGSSSPVPQDVLPLLSGQPDPRVLEIKQWIVNLDYRRALAEPPEAKAIQDLLDGYFQGMRTLLDIDIQSWRIVDNEVMVTTTDGELPMDAMSQGTVSIFGWVGALMQRQFDIQGKVGGPVIVLVDEIDAHMHPEWQQAMVSRLKTAFPEAQFVVTTHSPFLAIGRTSSEIIRVVRDPRTGKLQARSPEFDTTTLSVGNVLVSQLFGLQSQLDFDVQRDVLIRRRLSVKPELTEAERSELRRVDGALTDLNPAENIHDPALRSYVEQFHQRTRALGISEATDEGEKQRQSLLASELIDQVLREEATATGQAQQARPASESGGAVEERSS